MRLPRPEPIRDHRDTRYIERLRSMGRIRHIDRHGAVSFYERRHCVIDENRVAHTRPCLARRLEKMPVHGGADPDAGHATTVACVCAKSALVTQSRDLAQCRRDRGWRDLPSEQGTSTWLSPVLESGHTDPPRRSKANLPAMPTARKIADHQTERSTTKGWRH